MTSDNTATEDLEFYEDLFDPFHHNRRLRRTRHAEPHHRAKVSAAAVIAQLAETPEGVDGGTLQITYQPGEYEASWLLDSLRAFYDRGLVTDVVALVKGGKEASVYRCVAHPQTGTTLLAAKVYRPRRFRNLRNDTMYREGRAVLTADGRAVNQSDDRILRALGKKTTFGQQVQHTSWLMHEYAILARLHQAGGAVPRPYAASENAILMSYLGDERQAAPTLSSVRLKRDEACSLFQEAMRNVELMLQHGVIHGDLSAYNILYWQGQLTLIDFPQVTDVRANRNAAFILRRDVTRLCEYFARQGVTCDAEEIMARFQSAYLTRDEALEQLLALPVDE